jgi:hypothetical protein
MEAVCYEELLVSSPKSKKSPGMRRSIIRRWPSDSSAWIRAATPVLDQIVRTLDLLITLVQLQAARRIYQR